MIYLSIDGEKETEVLAELTDTFNEPINDDYQYFYCRCPNPMNICWRFKPVKPGFYIGVCPDCNTEVGISIGNFSYSMPLTVIEHGWYRNNLVVDEEE